MTAAQALARAASELVGAPFRLRGRDPQTGLDCIGVVTTALARAGRAPPTLPHYAMRNVCCAHFLELLPHVGLVPSRAGPAPGDVLLLRPSAAQYHLAIIGPSGLLVHAHAGLGRVVESPAPLPWPVQAHWHLIEN